MKRVDLGRAGFERSYEGKISALTSALVCPSHCRVSQRFEEVWVKQGGKGCRRRRLLSRHSHLRD